MLGVKGIRKAILIEGILILACVSVMLIKNNREKNEPEVPQESEQSIDVAANGNYIKWVDFKVSYEALCRAY